ncbi:sensor histidine kinase [Glycomyces buryatensis]|uniref:histidine kinase n=1 Tax=Glycomyces buryatensis TaxID=2570927 RepID=A0A4V4HQC7_9ACTN|nr:sensor histidine kinase [Glycomyces buryatensis]THV33376.1 sensor histidine kinase [Glycomyces buryatensis]
MQAASSFRRLHGWFHGHPLSADTLFAAALWATYASTLLVISAAADNGVEFGWPQVAMLGLGLSPIALRRKWLWGSMLLAVGLLVLAMAIDNPWIIGDNGVGWLVLTYSAAAHRPLLRAVTASAVLWIPVTASVLFYYWPVQDGQAGSASLLTFLNTAMAVTAFWVGLVMRNRRMKVEELTDRARVAEQTQEALAAQAVAEEQRRIARELHDVVAHHISVIGVMSEGAKRVLRTDPDAAEDALTTVNQTARTALREMRDLLAVLRKGGEETSGAELEPQPTVDSIRALVAQTKEAGLPVRYSVRGKEYPLPTGVSLAVYRIVQEALTNTIKHAGPKARSGVVVDYGEDEFRVSIGDSGRGAPVVNGFSGGHGLIGMRERATLYGGTLVAGPGPGGGYLVEAHFPKNAHLQGVKR